MSLQFTPREVAVLSGAPKSTVEKAIEEKVFTPTKARSGKRERRVLPAHAVPYAKIMRSIKYRMNPLMKRRLAAALHNLEDSKIKTLRFELEPAVEMDVGKLVGDTVERATAYAAARDALISQDEDILGGTPVIRGTRISVYSILGRLDGGDTVDEVLEDYPGLSRDSVETAVIFARSHPLVGRPGGRPWSTTA
ncbi:MAG: DUF433 domain-containing protein [Caulobacteraceae bacterium]